MKSFSRFLLVLSLSLFCSFFVPFSVDAEDAEKITVYIQSMDFNGLNTLSVPAHSSASTSVTGTLSTSGTSTGSVANQGSITNYSGYFYTGSTLASLVNTTYGLTFTSFRAYYTNSQYNGSTSVSFNSGTLYRCTGTNRDGVSVDAVCSSTSLSARVYEFATAQVGSSASSSSSATNKDSGTFSGTFSLPSSSRTVTFAVMMRLAEDFPLEIGKEYDYSLTFRTGAYFTIQNSLPTKASVISDIAAFNTGASTSQNQAYFINNIMFVKGTFTPISGSPDFRLLFSFEIPEGYSFTGYSDSDTHYDIARYPDPNYCFDFIPSDTSIVVDSLTNFEGSEGMNTSKDQLDGVIGEYDKVEGSLFDSSQTAFDQFDPSSLLSFSAGITAAIAHISQLMISIISAMGEFSVLYTVGIVMVFFGMLIGLWRFFK